MKPVKTVSEIIAECLLIVPQNAYSFRGSSEAINLCASPLYTAYLTPEGVSVPLSLVDGKYGCLYVRVSTQNQKLDGWSLADQIERGVKFFVDRGMAFRVFNDGGLSGKLPIDDEDMIKKMLASSAKRYEKAYRAVFFSDGRYEAEKPEMEKWLDKYVAGIKNGTESLNSESDDFISGEFRKKNFSYRPAITELMRQVNAGMVHTIAVTDISRLSRNQSLTRQLAEDLNYKKVVIVGLIESMDFINDDDDLGAQITASVLTVVAEYRLREICVSVIRGIVQMLQSNKPHGILPHWLDRDEKDNIIINEERAEIMRRIIDYVLDNPELGFGRVAKYLNENKELYPPIVTKHHKNLRGNWAADTLRALLNNDNLIGCQSMFGRKWLILPAIIDENKYARLKELNEYRRDKTIVTVSKTPCHLLTGIIRCQCGGGMTYVNNKLGMSRYRCTLTAKVTGIAKDHCSCVAGEIENFIEELMREKPQIIIGQIEGGSERNALQSEMDNLRKEKIRLTILLSEANQKARQQAQEDLQALKRNASEPLIAAMVAEDEEVKRITASISDAENGIKQRQYIYNTIAPSDHIADVKKQIAQWDKLGIMDKNALIKKIIAEIQIHKISVAKNTEGFKVLIIPNTPSRIPLPRIRTIKKSNYKNSKYDAMPTVESWVSSF